MVAAGSPQAAETAVAVLAEGGSAVDAVIAGSAVQCVLEPAWCGVGGDAFLLICPAGGEAIAINGSGAAPRRAADGLAGLDRVPRFGPRSVAVPGLVSAWDLAHERFARLPLPALLEPAVAIASDGFVPDHRLRAAITALDAENAETPALRALLSGKPDGRLAMPDLAKTLVEIGRGGSGYFYRGEFALQAEQQLHASGGVLSARDLAAHQVDWSRPLSVSYRGCTVHVNPPVSMGSVLLAELQIFERCASSWLAAGSPGLIDLMVRCKIAAFADAFADDDGPGTEDRLSAERARWWSEHLPPAAVGPLGHQLAGGPDTTCLAVRDAEGMTVTMVHSLFNSFGSREVVQGTGVILNDRLASLAIPGRDARGRRLVPGGRPLHTLNTYLVTRGQDVVIAGATPGGRGQVQTSFQALVNLIDKGMTPLEAVSAPRWVHGTPRTPADDGVLYLEAGFGAETADRLTALGHSARLSGGADDDMFGSCVAVGSAGQGFAVADGRRGSAARST